MIINTIFTVILILIMNIVHAELPVSVFCKPMAVSSEVSISSMDKFNLLLIHNLSKIDLWLTHTATESKTDAGGASRLQAGHWSALALDKIDFELNCIESLPGHEQLVPCTGFISMCRSKPIKTPSNSTGFYWAGENMTLANLIEHLSSQGFELEPSQSMGDLK